MPWSDLIASKRGIRNMCRKKLVDDIFDPLKDENEWYVLVVDDFGMKLMSSCFKTEEVMSFNIAIIENLGNPARESLNYLPAIYVLYPSVQNCGLLQSDFVCFPKKYSSFNLFFLTEVPDEIYKQFLNYAAPGLVATFREIDLLFLPYESQIFSLCEDYFFSAFFDSFKEVDISYCAFIAKKLASLCAVLKSKPRIRYRKGFIKNLIIAEAVHLELNQRLKNSDSSSEESDPRPRCELLIVDRGFDCISPVIHEFTLQAMAHDFLDIEDDVYEHKVEDSKGSTPSARQKAANQISLTEGEPLWVKLRHEHIANVGKEIDGALRTDRLLEKHMKMSRFKKLPDLGGAVKQHLAFQKNQAYVIYRSMANECMKLYCSGLNVLTNLEQDMASGDLTAEEGRSFLMRMLANAEYSLNQKLRVLLQYIFFSKGISKRDFDDILNKADLPFSEARYITNALHLDVDIFRPGHCKPVADLPQYSADVLFEQSRWVPAMKNLMMGCMDGKLSLEKYPYLDSQDRSLVLAPVRSGYWCSDKKDGYVSRLIIFVAGGVTYSEMRCVYEVMEKYKGWEIFLGGDDILTPNRFLDKLRSLRCFIYK